MGGGKAKFFECQSVLGIQQIFKQETSAAIFARDVANIVTLHVEEGELTVRADSAEAGQGLTRLMASVEGNGLDIAFNVRFLIDVLAALNTPQVALELNAATNPGIIKAVGDDAFIHVVMPMHLGHR